MCEVFDNIVDAELGDVRQTNCIHFNFIFYFHLDMCHRYSPNFLNLRNRHPIIPIFYHPVTEQNSTGILRQIFVSMVRSVIQYRCTMPVYNFLSGKKYFE